MHYFIYILIKTKIPPSSVAVGLRVLPGHVHVHGACENGNDTELAGGVLDSVYNGVGLRKDTRDNLVGARGHNVGQNVIIID